MNAKVKRWLPLVILFLLAIIAFSSGLHEKITLEAFQENKELLLEKVEQNPFISVLLFCLLYVGTVALSLPFATLLTLSGGFFFGNILGTFYVVISATVGATLVFLIAKSSVGKTLREKAGKLYSKIEGNMRENAVGYLLFLRLVPLFPFFLINIVPAMFNVSTKVFVLTTLFGIIPGSFVFVNVGTQLADIENLKDIVSKDLLLAFGLLGLFALIPTLYKQFKKAKTNV